ncbi:MAG: putative Fe-S cluster assembly protein SufT [Pseudomonadota bacterium]|nr:putative Fe-S cluster assembly protein SufT [Pseudomonadota bacterium]
MDNAKHLIGQTIALKKDCDATLVPSGQPLLLTKGTLVSITQALGGSVTVQVQGNLVLIHEDAVDSIGIEPDTQTLDEAKDKSIPLDDRAWALLKTCYDPEIPVNIVDLGLIYGCQCMESEDGLSKAYIAMTLTAPGCGMGPFLVEDVKRKVMLIPEIKEVDIEMVFDPPWSQDRMSDAAKLQLGLL